MTVVEFEQWARWSADITYQLPNGTRQPRMKWNELPKKIREEINKVAKTILGNTKRK